MQAACNPAFADLLDCGIAADERGQCIRSRDTPEPCEIASGDGENLEHENLLLAPFHDPAGEEDDADTIDRDQRDHIADLREEVKRVHLCPLLAVFRDEPVDDPLIEGPLVGGEIREHHLREATDRTVGRGIAIVERARVLRDEGFTEGPDLAGHLVSPLLTVPNIASRYRDCNRIIFARCDFFA